MSNVLRVLFALFVIGPILGVIMVQIGSVHPTAEVYFAGAFIGFLAVAVIAYAISLAKGSGGSSGSSHHPDGAPGSGTP